MDFRESTDYLLSLGFELSVRKFGLENTFTLLEALGHPEREYRKVQVAGTNGKGSVCAFLESIVLAAGMKVGLNTSPHLVSITERVRINGSDLSEEEFAGYATIVRRESESLVRLGKLKALPTYFEHVTAIALLAFREARVDISILETGLGGRFDATTAARSEVAVITPIDLDHTNILGNTPAEIAAEKAAIIREESSVVISGQLEEALKVISDRCAEFGIEPVRAGSIRAEELNGTVTFETENGRYENVKLALAGRHQVGNAKTAIAAAEMLARLGLPIRKQHIEIGLADATHRGRLEYFNGMLFDGAHNVSGAIALRSYLKEEFDLPITMIFATMKEKDLTRISDILFPLAQNLVLACPANPRAMPTDELLEYVPADYPKSNVYAPGSVAEAVRLAQDLSGGGLIVVTGSLYLIGEVQAHLQEQKVVVRNKS